MKKQPLISVIMPVYNAQDYLRFAIESILKQTYQNFELIIVNDASTDDSLAIISHYQKQNSDKIKVISLKKNRNCGGDMCANQGLKHAKGEFVARMDADDIAHLQRFEKQVAFLNDHPEVFLVGSNAYVINKQGTIIGEKKEPSTTAAIYKSYCTFHPLIHPACMFRRMVGDVPFTYDINYSANNDYYTFFKLLCKGFKFVNLEEKLLYYRIHQRNDTFVHIRKKFLNTLKIRVKMTRDFGYRPTTKDVFTTFVQTIILFSLPEIVVAKLYLFSKGIIKPRNPLKSSFFVKKSLSTS